MTRRPAHAVGFDAALPVARARGLLMQFRRDPGIPADLLIAGVNLDIVRIRKASRLHGSPEEISADFHDVIARLLRVPDGFPVSRERWPYSRFRVLRLFHVYTGDLTELCAEGKVLVALQTGSPSAILPRSEETFGAPSQGPEVSL